MNLPKVALIVAILFSAFSTSSAVDTVTTLTLKRGSGPSSHSINVPSGQYFELLSFVEFGTGTTKMVLQYSGATVAEAKPVSNTTERPLIIAGSASINFTFVNINVAVSGDGAMMTYRLVNPTATTTPTTPDPIYPSYGTAVVIPTDATGNIEILLESSTDLVTWTAATPGMYGASTEKRFFRVRAVTQ